MKSLTLAALACLLIASPAAAIPPPPNGFYGFFRAPQINCPSEDAALGVFAALVQAPVPADIVDAAAAEFKCDLGYVPGPVAVGESHLLGDVVGPGGTVTFYSVHVGNSDREWWVVYADARTAQ
jgi:hypothetical protein